MFVVTISASLQIVNVCVMYSVL